MREYTIARVQGEIDWKNVPTLAIDQLMWTENCDVAAWAQICYDDRALHVHLSAREAHIRAEHTSVIGMPCEDSCLEFFFCPVPGDDRYFNIEFNPNGCMYLGTGRNMPTLIRLLPEGDPIVPHTNRTADGWEIFYDVPYDFIRRLYPEFRAERGIAIRANCFKCGDLTVQEHYLAWNRPTSETPAFHRPQDFGRMIFG